MEDEPLIEPRRNIQTRPATARSVSPSVTEDGRSDILENRRNKNEFTARLGLALAACTLGSSFQFGYNSGIVNSPQQVLKDFYNETYEHRYSEKLSTSSLTLLWSVTVSIFCVGGMVGGLSAGYWANRFGRKGALLRNNLVMIVAVAIEMSAKYAKSYEMLIIGRFFVGVNAGINTGIAPMYLSEISPVSLRGLCGTFNQLCITFGVLTSEVMGLSKLFGSPERWPFAFGFPLIMVLWQLSSLSFCPESPRYLFISKSKGEEAERALIWLRGTTDVSDEIEEMISERNAAKDVKKFTIPDLFRESDLRQPLIICIVMHLSQQFSGINAVIYYSTPIFEDAGLSETMAQTSTIIVGAVNVSMTFVSALLMDRLGRRKLHLTGLGGMFVAAYILTIGLALQSHVSWFRYLCIVAVVVYIIFFASGPGSIPWFFVAELFAQGPRSAAVSVGVLVNWTANFTVGLVYPNLEEWIHAYSFIPFLVALALCWLFTLFKVPETKGKTIEEIGELFKKRQQTDRRPSSNGYRSIPTIEI